MIKYKRISYIACNNIKEISQTARNMDNAINAA
jgi:hypothetical protein